LFPGDFFFDMEAGNAALVTLRCGSVDVAIACGWSETFLSGERALRVRRARISDAPLTVRAELLTVEQPSS